MLNAVETVLDQVSSLEKKPHVKSWKFCSYTDLVVTRGKLFDIIRC